MDITCPLLTDNSYTYHMELSRLCITIECSAKIILTGFYAFCGFSDLSVKLGCDVEQDVDHQIQINGVEILTIAKIYIQSD
ncbi:hypothetical protein IMCC3135_10360 [Granulosicoccus antarcticus IMCC3135]|uniref:Uncharacterized protein n=1 Tax=Granulosicoccus antarcticus IMCC3135 TaxID=1192854 RepID=A0A2Z2NLG1_9GAMM|nr:hypothetical protein IMCC3135_10360 [Granulosicoccus antarcticus IMCC3135]